MDPNQQSVPNQYPTSPSYGPPGQPLPAVVSGSSPSGSQPPKNNKVLLFSIVGGSLGLLLIIGLVIILAGSKTPAPKQAEPTTKTSQTPDSGAATASGIQVINDSISQDISSLNEEQDFPSGKLEDKALGL